MNILYSLLAGIGFGLAMFLRKMSVQRIGLVGFILETVTEAILAVILVSIIFPFNINHLSSKISGVVYGIAGELSIGLGVIFYFLAVKYGSSLIPSVIAPVLSAITASLLAVIILGESLSSVKLSD
jgi:uncharacterized membrane protein